MKNDIKDKIRLKKLEDIELIESFETILLEKRAHVFKMPDPGSTVAAFMSGGLDSTITISILLEKYKLKVIPIHLVRATRPESDPKIMKQTVINLEAYFRKNYPKQFKRVVFIDLLFPPKSIFLDLYNIGLKIVNKTTKQRMGIPFQPAVFFLTAVDYLLSKNITKVKTIFASDLSNVVDFFAYSSLTSYRAINVAVCAMLNDFTWQITSLPMEKELGFYMDKGEYLKFFNNLDVDLPLRITRTCQYNYKYHCGKCIVCDNRKTAFKDANVMDATVYETERTDIIGKLKRKYSVLNRLLEKM